MAQARHRRRQRDRADERAPNIGRATTQAAPFSIVRVPYALVRAAHLAWSCAVVPLGLFHVVDGRTTNGFVLFLLFCAAVFLMLFLIALEQADYPVSFGGALLRTAPLFASTAAAFHARDLFFAAYWNVGADLVGLSLLFTVTTLFALRQSDATTRKYALALLAPLALLTGCAALFIDAPLVHTVLADPSPELLVAAVAFVGQAASTTFAWFRMSVFSRYLDSDVSKARVRAWEHGWTTVAALGLVGAMLAAVVILMSAR